MSLKEFGSRQLRTMMTKRGIVKDDERYIYIVQLAAIAFAFCAHLFLTFFFIEVGYSNFVVYNICVLIFYGLCFALTIRRHYFLSSVFLSLEVSIYALISIFFFGFSSHLYMYFVLIIAMQVIIPYARVLFRFFLAVIIWGTMLFLQIYSLKNSAISAIGDMESMFSIFNLNITVLGLIILLCLDNMVDTIITGLNKTEIDAYRRKAMRDSLTQLYNRLYAEDIFTKLRSPHHEEEYCIAMMDIDDFKKINDKYGHALGDEVLKSLSAITLKVIRREDLVFRWGGEEFLILLKDVNLQQATALLERLRSNIEESQLRVPTGDIIKYTVTIGVSQLNRQNIEESIEECDRRMYIGKRGTKNVVIYQDEAIPTESETKQ